MTAAEQLSNLRTYKQVLEMFPCYRTTSAIRMVCIRKEQKGEMKIYRVGGKRLIDPEEFARAVLSWTGTDLPSDVRRSLNGIEIDEHSA